MAMNIIEMAKEIKCLKEEFIEKGICKIEEDSYSYVLTSKVDLYSTMVLKKYLNIYYIYKDGKFKLTKKGAKLVNYYNQLKEAEKKFINLMINIE